jgi:hypothetical protein
MKKIRFKLRARVMSGDETDQRPPGLVGAGRGLARVISFLGADSGTAVFLVDFSAVFPAATPAVADFPAALTTGAVFTAAAVAARVLLMVFSAPLGAGAFGATAAFFSGTMAFKSSGSPLLEVETWPPSLLPLPPKTKANPTKRRWAASTIQKIRRRLTDGGRAAAAGAVRTAVIRIVIRTRSPNG